MLSGAGGYFQGEHILRECGQELRRKGVQRVCLIGGKTALAAALPELESGLHDAQIQYTVHLFSGFCTAGEIEEFAAAAEQEKSDCILGVGGGKTMDLTKAVAAQLQLPVFTVPTSAATCAAYAALSIVYNQQGCQDHTRYHLDEVSGVFSDTAVLAKAPARLLAAGMADAMAKSCEYSSMRPRLEYGDVDISKYMGYNLARVADEILLTCGEQAYRDNSNGIVSPSLEDAVYVSIAATGIISGMGGFAGRTGSRFAIASCPVSLRAQKKHRQKNRQRVEQVGVPHPDYHTAAARKQKQQDGPPPPFLPQGKERHGQPEEDIPVEQGQKIP